MHNQVLVRYNYRENCRNFWRNKLDVWLKVTKKLFLASVNHQACKSTPTLGDIVKTESLSRRTTSDLLKHINNTSLPIPRSFTFSLELIWKIKYHNGAVFFFPLYLPTGYNLKFVRKTQQKPLTFSYILTLVFLKRCISIVRVVCNAGFHMAPTLKWDCSSWKTSSPVSLVVV